MSARQNWSGDDWENHINTLLSLRYGPGDYQRVPAEHGGDCGIEGFSIPDGRAYQCYAPAEPLPVRVLHERQRDKMTQDIAKFIRNKDRLRKLLGNTKICRWVLVVPEHKSAHLVEHCTTKSKEVLDAKLPYVSSDFRVVVITDDEFAFEQRVLASRGAAYVKLEPFEVDAGQVDSYANSNVSGIANLRRKLAVALEHVSEDDRAALTRELVHAYLVGQFHLQRLHLRYPEVHGQVLAFVAQAERRIRLDSRITAMSAAEFFRQQFDTLRDRLIREIQSAEPIADDLVMQTVAEWLMRCPLDFHQPTRLATAAASVMVS